ncbi:YCF48-related protein [Pelomonas sp. SE-A7]|uniref:WD40/YVTN/BNR-like repeat-containing protein n=1 Tax=Pelomonas sp. SE-A7 TaxID=3054953 RepID=UPI00259CFAE2|nr:YCF48-related protein [Pelomonas sp. SE-A7]MDM4765041.1 YCF48-related protein [Pelomonas sp. SE-A7]
MKQHLLLACCLFALCFASLADPLGRPARESRLLEQRLINGIDHAGLNRLVAAGQRGHIAYSDDQGQHWTQARVPLSSDLTALQFVDAKRGYAVGHDGVVLGSSDGGASWQQLLDGRRANQLLLDHLKKLPAGKEREALLAEAERNLAAGPDKPFLDLFFTSGDEGFVVGAYNLIFQTRDGGKTWTPWFERTDNPRLLNLYAIRAQGGSLFIAGEAGLLMKLDAKSQRFVTLDAGYKGSFFGLLDAGDALLAHGMRGNARLSRDGGKSWTPVTTGLAASITASTRSRDGALWLADQGGNLVRSRDGGASFQRVALPEGVPLATLALTADRLVLGGARGLRSVALPTP